MAVADKNKNRLFESATKLNQQELVEKISTKHTSSYMDGRGRND